MKKRSIWQRIQAVICFLLLLCVFVPFGAVAISPGMVRDLIVLVDGQQVTGLAAAMDGVVPSMRVVYGVAAVIGLLCSLRMLTLVFARGGRDRSGVSLQNASDGPIHISVPAVETLVSQGIRDVPGLSDVRMKVHDYGDSVTIEIAMSARSDINIPETMMRLQSRIKAYVQESAGIEVREVRLNVEKVVLADGIQALPAGRGMKRVPASEQENSTPTLAPNPNLQSLKRPSLRRLSRQLRLQRSRMTTIPIPTGTARAGSDGLATRSAKPMRMRAWMQVRLRARLRVTMRQRCPARRLRPATKYRLRRT